MQDEDDDTSAFDAEKMEADKRLVMREFGQKLRSNLGKIPFSEDVTSAFYCAMDGQTPAFVKAVLFGALAYFILPTDAIPDFIPITGYTDDMAAIAAAVTTIAVYINRDVKEKTAEKLKRWFGEDTSSES